jgi:hypothetical protein
MSRENAITKMATLVIDEIESKVKDRCERGFIPSQSKAFIASALSLAGGKTYKFMPSQATEIYHRIIAVVGNDLAKEVLICFVMQGLIDTISANKLESLPARVKEHQLKQYQRIVDPSWKQEINFGLVDDLFLKEFGLATLRLYAAAAQVIDPCAGISRSLIFKAGGFQIVRNGWFFLKTGGFKCYFEIHTHTGYLDEFNEEGWNECYRCCADLYSLHPNVLGMHGGSWFYDPALSEHSPRLNYLKDIPVRGGAVLIFSSRNAQSDKDATSTSPTRKKLFDEGRYVPRVFSLVWPKSAQKTWAVQFSTGKIPHSTV